MVDKAAGIFYMDFMPDVTADSGLYFDNLCCDIRYLMAPAGHNSTMVEFKRPGEKMEYAHAITCHLAQVSQANQVLFMDAFIPDDEYLMRLRYTAVTRAKKRIIYLIPYNKYDWFDLRNIEELRQMKDRGTYLNYESWKESRY